MQHVGVSRRLWSAFPWCYLSTITLHVLRVWSGMVRSRRVVNHTAKIEKILLQPVFACLEVYGVCTIWMDFGLSHDPFMPAEPAELTTVMLVHPVSTKFIRTVINLSCCTCEAMCSDCSEISWPHAQLRLSLKHTRRIHGRACQGDKYNDICSTFVCRYS